MIKNLKRYSQTQVKYRAMLFAVIVAVLAAASFLSLSQSGEHGATSLLWLFIIFPIFGYSLSAIILKTKAPLAETIGYSTGLLIAVLLGLGLGLNTLGLVSHQATLIPKFVVPAFDAIFLTVLACSAKRKSSLLFVKPKSTAIASAAKALPPIIFPLLSILGVVQLNNGGSSFFAVANLCAIILYQLFFFFVKRERSEGQYLFNIFCVSLSLVLSFSMRSNHIIGFDINQEFQVFSAVVKNGVWHPHLFSSTYNACLSITVLPAVIKSFVQLSSEYVFKFAMQIVLCIVPLVVFSIARKWLQSEKLAFLAALFFIFQNQFIIEFPALIRQQTAMLFFGLIFVTASSLVLSKRSKQALTLLFGLGLVVSHYSTAYVCLAFLLIVALLRPAAEKLIYPKGRSKNDGPVAWSISTFTILILLLFAFCWYGEILDSTGNVVQNITQSVAHFDSFFAADSRSSFVVNNLHIGSTSYNGNTLNTLEKTRSIQDSFSPAVYKNEGVVPTAPEGPDLNSSLKRLINSLVSIVVPLVVKIIAVLGCMVVLVEVARRRRVVDEGLFVVSSGVLFTALIVLPFISQDYNLERLYQQLLVVVSSVFILGLSFLFAKWKKLGQGLTLVLLVFYFMCTSNLASQLFLSVSDVNVANTGNNYDRFYVKDGEVDSLTWLNQNYKSGGINIDRYAALRAQAYTNLPPRRYIQGLLPSEISKKGYVYATNANINSDLVFDYYQNQVISYTYPSQLLSQEKNTVYDNQNSKVYK